MITIREPSFSVGKYLVSPLTTKTLAGDYAASVSIRSGHGSRTHDRVMRFLPLFATREGALRYAIQQGIHWLQQPSRAEPGATKDAHWPKKN
ncbi:hypothetical protein AACH06_01240 [Ideonella sp. DXS29W]|uniref:Uncharacterized protein n=1 Tax=Ideonella lacteola TaxID=2984193 RepID=A0ABU9BKH7_9BURK